ncbi:MAG: hypothetical protein MK297_05870 [Planctomycetes bacterium]|nr:hypothetical protein [Planctomycetota bacterium]
MNQLSQSAHSTLSASPWGASRRLIASAMSLSLLLGAGCNLNSDPVPVGSSAGPVGSYQDLEGVNFPGAFVVDSNFRGTTTNLKIVRMSWGRLVDVLDVEGVKRHEDFVVNEGIQTDFVDYEVKTNPITDKTSVRILHPFGSAAYVSALESLDDSLGPIFDKSLDVDELPPFPIMPRNAALSIQFNDILDVRYDDGDWLDSSNGLLVSSSSGQLNSSVVQVITDYPPSVPYEARVVVNSNYGDVADYDGDGEVEFHPTRIIVDMTVSELEAAVSNPPLTVNSVGLPASLLGITDANLAIRIPTGLDLLSGQSIVLTNPTDHPLDFTDNGSRDISSVTDDVVRAMRTGSASDANNGFLGDDVAPQIIGSLTVDLQGSVTSIGNPGDGLYRVAEARFNPPACAPSQLKLGEDVLEYQGVRAIVMGGVQAGAVVYQLDLQVVSPPDGVIQLGVAQIQTPYDPVTDNPDCFLRFSPNAGSPPVADVSKNSQVLVRFSEPMDPDSLNPFDNMTLTRVDIEDENLLPQDYVIGTVQASADLREFSFVPSLPLDRSIVSEYKFALAGGDAAPTDLSGNAIDLGDIFRVSFGLSNAESTSVSRGFALRFADINQLVLNAEDAENNWTEFRDAQLIYDLNDESISPRPVTHYSVAADRDKPIPAVMTPFPAGVQTPLSPLGSKMHTLWRYCDLGFSLTDETNMNIDIEGLAWAPAGGSVVSDAYDEFEVRVAHSAWLPDELLDPNSGFPSHPQSGLNTVYSTNFLDQIGDPGTVLHPRERGYVVNPGDLFIGQGNGSNMLPFPVNQDVPADEFLYYTWRDTSLLGTAANQGAGAILDIEDLILFGGGGAAKTYTPGNVPSIGLPLLMEFRCYVDTGALGLNAFDISLATNSSARPNFRAFSTGGYNTNNDPQFKDPDLEDAADGGFNPASNPPGATTPGVDNTFYIGQVDLVTRVSRSHSIWFDSGLTNPSYQDPVVEPAPEDLPSGTSIVMDYRGATITSINPTTQTNTILSNPAQIDLYGEQVQGSPGTINFQNGDSGWKNDISEIDGAQFFQLRLTFISNAATDRTPWLSTLGFAYGE